MVSRALSVITSPPVLRPDWETLVWLAFRQSKLPDLDACLTSSSLRQFCDATEKPRPAWFWGPIQETVAVNLRPKSPNWSCRFWGPNQKTRPSGFKAKPLTNCRPWFWGSTRKRTLLISTCTVLTPHNATRPLDHPTIEYPTCATILDPLHQVSYSCHDPHRCTPCRTYHLHTTRQATHDSSTKQKVMVKQSKCLGF
jgi:hypothetical protein